MTRKMLGSISEVLRGTTKVRKVIAEQENNFWKDCESRHSSISVLKDTFEWMKLNEIERSKR